MLGGVVGYATNRYTLIIINSYSSGKIYGTYHGGLMGAHSWMSEPGIGINSYYLVSDTVKNSVGKSGQSITSTAITELTQDVINSLNKYIEDDPDEKDTTGWAKWVYDGKSDVTLDFNTRWDGTEWIN